jgi:dynein heavy chain
VALVRSLEVSAQEWIATIVTAIAKEGGKSPVGNGPLSEIEFWRDRNASLSTLHEQLSLPIVQTILQILVKAGAMCSSQLEFQLMELNKLFTEAKDNVKFLGTLERHFKNIIIGSMQSVQDSLPSLMNAIRMVWIISRHYNRDERMVPLMSRIAWELANKVGNAIGVKSILRDPPAVARKKITDAKNLLDSWSKVGSLLFFLAQCATLAHRASMSQAIFNNDPTPRRCWQTYFAVRERIEQSGRDQRWEFDRKKLFEQTSYMSLRCADLLEITQVIEQFSSIFGPELKSVTGDPAQIDEVIKRVEGLIIPFEQVPFDIFSKRYASAWESLMSHFRECILQIEDMAKNFIDSSFTKLRRWACFVFACLPACRGVVEVSSRLLPHPPRQQSRAHAQTRDGPQCRGRL